MHPIYRRLIGIIASIILMAVAISRCRNTHARAESQGWTPAVESQMRDIFYQQSARLATNDEDRNAFADCCVSKIKEMFPNGLSDVGANMSDSMKVAIMKVGANCVMNMKSKASIWTPDQVQQLKLAAYSYPETKMLPPKMKEEYVTCVTDAIIDKYAKGFQPVNKDSVKAFIMSRRKRCLQMLANRYGKLKMSKAPADTASAL